MIIAALITDYERALLDALRENNMLRRMATSVANLPWTAEHEQKVRELYRDEVRFHKMTDEAAGKELEHIIKCEEGYRLTYKARGYKEPYEYGKGMVKVLFVNIEGGKG